MPIGAIPGILLQGLLYVGIAPLVVGVLRRIKARLQGRTGPRIDQPYRDLLKLFRRQPIVTDTTSWIFSTAPYVVFGCYTLLGCISPIVFLPQPGPEGNSLLGWPVADLLTLIYLLGLARFIMGLAGLDAGSPFGGLGSGREMFLHVLAEPTLIFAVYALALSAHTTSLPLVMQYYRELGFLTSFQRPEVWLIFLALVLVMLIETGRIPFDNPATQLELTMVGRSIYLEYAGRHLALLEWSEAMRLTFFLTLLINLFFPALLASPEINILNVVLILAYPLKLLALLSLLAAWEMMRARLRLRAVAGPAGLALVFSLIAVIILTLDRYGL